MILTVGHDRSGGRHWCLVTGVDSEHECLVPRPSSAPRLTLGKFPDLSEPKLAFFAAGPLVCELGPNKLSGMAVGAFWPTRSLCLGREENESPLWVPMSPRPRDQPLSTDGCREEDTAEWGPDGAPC